MHNTQRVFRDFEDPNSKGKNNKTFMIKNLGENIHDFGEAVTNDLYAEQFYLNVHTTAIKWTTQ